MDLDGFGATEGLGWWFWVAVLHGPLMRDVTAQIGCAISMFTVFKLQL